ncbi:MAG: hypothetical protein ACI4KF_10325 [Huintestinicola sp.]
MSNYTINEQALREFVQSIGKSAAVACTMAVLSEVVLKGIINARPTKIVVENGIPAALYTIGEKDGPRAVYVSSRREKINLTPVIFFGGLYLGSKLFLEYREKNFANVRTDK